MEEIFYILVVAQLLMGLWGLWSGLRWLAMARRSVARHPGFFAPRVALICPCKGIERGLQENLSALTGLDYPGYEVFFVLATSTDPAHETVRRVVEASGVPAHIVIAGRPENCGEKVNNLRFAAEQLPPGFDVLVFADSDGRPGRQWLTHLVAPLSDVRIGATTTFRWWLPERGGFWSALGAAWDSSIVTMQGEHSHNFCWGGGTAIRRTVFEESGVRAAWAGTVSDDWAMTRALRNFNRPIHFVPECLTPTVRDTTLRSLVEFTNRQLIITRVYAPRIWAAGAIAHLLYCATLIMGAVLIGEAIYVGQLWLNTAMLLLMIMLLSAAKGVVRWLAVLDLMRDWKYKLESYAWAWTVLAPLAPFLYALNFMVSAFSRRIVWRGIRYQLISAGQTRIL